MEGRYGLIELTFCTFLLPSWKSSGFLNNADGTLSAIGEEGE